MSNFYSATGELIKKESAVVPKPVLKESIEYKANGNLVIEKDEKEHVTHAVKLPSQQSYNSDNLGLQRRYIEEE
jgi:hypothetical protein